MATPDNLDFYGTVMFYPTPRTLQPDRLATFYAEFTVEPAARAVEPRESEICVERRAADPGALPGAGNRYAHRPMLIAYLPDGEDPGERGPVHAARARAAQPAQAMQGPGLTNNIQRLKLDVAQHVPIHGAAPSSQENFLEAGGHGKAGDELRGRPPGPKADPAYGLPADVPKCVGRVLSDPPR